MVIHTFGDPKDPAILLIHPMLLSGRQMIEGIGKKIPGSYFLIAPDQGGHGDDTGAFTPKKDAEELTRYLNELGKSEVELLFAASMGGITAMALLNMGELRFRNTYLDGVPLARIKGITRLLSVPGMVAARNKAAGDPAAIGGKIAPLYGEEMGLSMAKQLGRLPKANVISIEKACLNGCAVPVDESVCGRLTFEWGGKEINRVGGEPLAGKLYPWAKIVIREGLGHCERMGKEQEQYARDLAARINSR